MKIRNMSVTKHHDTDTLELFAQLPDRRMFSVCIKKPLDSEDLPDHLFSAGIQLRNLIRAETEDDPK